ncbi:MAG: hypothetical protein MRY83_20155 [Flavobacteriales bacterium]|nr:hypothetical protein [Flavobacteriales bacterium]
MKSLVLIIINMLLLKCYGQDSLKVDSILLEMEEQISESFDYLKNRDLDGDKLADAISFDYSGGAHCCYKMTLKLTTQKTEISFPFQMDGGYMYGVDGTYHDKFRVEDFDHDGRDEIFMKIESYNYELYDIPKKWTRKYGIKTNYILFDFDKGVLNVRDTEIP